MIAAILNQLTGRVVGGQIESREDGAKKVKSRKPFKESIAEVIAAVRESALLRYMVIITAIPNIVLPWMTYQFNVAMDNYYASEQGVLSFLGLFRGISNGAMFVILLFSSRLISRWGVGTSLLFHPCNYLISFAAIFFRFDLITARLRTFHHRNPEDHPQQSGQGHSLQLPTAQYAWNDPGVSARDRCPGLRLCRFGVSDAHQRNP